MSHLICDFPYEEADENVDFWHEKRVVARKEHRCCECCQPIPPGMRYGRASYVFDGKWHTPKRCTSCLILAELVATITGECPLWGGLWDSVCYANDNYGVDIPHPQDYRKKWEET